MMNPLKKEEKINTEVYNVDRNENEQQNQQVIADHSSDANRNEQRKKDIDLLSYQYDLLSQKVENKKLSLENKTLEEEKAALQKESKTLTSMNEKLAAEKKILLRENESISFENKRLQDENMRIKRELEMLIIRQNDESAEGKRQISSLSGEVELQQSYSSHTKQLEETMKRIWRCKLDQLQKTSSKDSTEKMDELSNTFREKLRESTDKLNADQKLLREKMEQIQEASRKESIERMEELETLFKEKLIETTQKLNTDQDRLREKMDQLQEASSLKSAETMKELNSALDKKLKETAVMMRTDQEKLIVENVSWGKVEEKEDICELMNEVTSTRLESNKHNVEDETHERVIVPEELNNALVLATVTPNKDINEIEAKDRKDDINDNNEKNSMSLNDALSECDTRSSGDVSEHGSLDIIPEEKIFHIHDKQINHVDICCFNRKELLIAASGHIVKVTRIEDGKLLWTTAGRGRRNVSCMNTMPITGLTVLLACGYYGNNIDYGSSIDFICLKTFTTLTSFACSSPVYVMSTCKTGGKDLLSCAYQSGSIDIFDMRSQRLLTTLPGTRENPIGFDKFILGRDFHLAVAGNVENYIDIWHIGRDESKVTLTIPVQCKKMNSLCTIKQTFGGQVSIAVGTQNYAGGWNILIFKMNNYNAVKTIHSTCLRGLMYLKPVRINGVLKLASGCYLSDEIDFWEIDTRRRDRSNGIKSKHSLTCYSSSFSSGTFTLAAGSRNGSLIKYKMFVDNRTKSPRRKRRRRGRRRSRGEKKPRVLVTSHEGNTKHECPKTHLSSLLL